jgi:HAD superfamily phosphoserine phosphatase-like hydrolase
MSTKKLVVFDLDGTLITGNTWEDFNQALGVTKDQDRELYSAFSKGDIDYIQWLNSLHELYNLSKNKQTKEQVLGYLTQYQLKPDAVAAVQAVINQGHDTLVLSGSFQMTADAVAFELGITDAIATNKCEFDEQGMLCRVASQGNERAAKVTALTNYCAKHNITLDECVVVGDGGNMLALLHTVKHGVVFTNSSNDLQTAASHTINSLADLPDLIATL